MIYLSFHLSILKMDDKEFNNMIEKRIAKGILTPMSKEMVRDCLKYNGALDDDTKKTYKNFLELYNENKIEIFWNNKTNDIDLFRSRSYPK